jgi:hypothetical protein
MPLRALWMIGPTRGTVCELLAFTLGGFPRREVKNALSGRIGDNSRIGACKAAVPSMRCGGLE